MTGVGLGGPGGHLRAISGPSRDHVWEVNIGSILGQFWVHSEVNPRPNLRNLINTENCLHLGLGRALRLNMMKYGSQGWSWWVPGIALPVPTRPTHTPVHPSPYPGYTPPHHAGSQDARTMVPPRRIVPWGSNPSDNSL